ncbi:MAG: hypothetical protein ACRERU_21330 [Methylococcales bacterium]
MAKRKLEKREALAIRERLKQVVDQIHGGDWNRATRHAGIDRTTALSWRGSERQTVPDVTQLMKLAQRGQVSLDWLFLGKGSMLRCEEVADGVLPALRAMLVAEYTASEAAPTLTMERASSSDWDAALPPADTLYRLCVEFLRPLVREAMIVVADRKLRHGRWRDEDVAKYIGPEKAADLEAKDERQNRRRSAGIHQHLSKLAVYLRERNRKGQLGYQFVTERLTLSPLLEGRAVDWIRATLQERPVPPPTASDRPPS